MKVNEKRRGKDFYYGELKIKIFFEIKIYLNTFMMSVSICIYSKN